MAVAVVQAGVAVNPVPRVADVKRLALLATVSHGVVVALQADVQLVRPGAVRVPVTVAHLITGVPDVGEVTRADIRF